jgi:hypothetical protein
MTKPMLIRVRIIDGTSRRAERLREFVAEVGKSVIEKRQVTAEVLVERVSTRHDEPVANPDFAIVHYTDFENEGTYLRQCANAACHKYFYSGGGVRPEYRRSPIWFKAAVSRVQMPRREHIEKLVSWLIDRVLSPTEAPKSPPEIPPEDDAAHHELLQVAVIGWTLRDDDRIDRLGTEALDLMLKSLPSERLSDSLRKAVGDIQSKIKKLVVPSSITKDEWEMHRSEIKDLGGRLVEEARGALEGGSAGLGPRANVP